MFKHIVAGLLLSFIAATPLAAAEFEEGTHYSVLNREATEDKEVMEFFSYACPGCNSFQRFMDALERGMGDEITITYVPVGFGQSAFRATQELFYVMQAYGKVEDLHDDVYRRIHVDHRSINSTEAAREFLAENGISVEDFDKAVKSFATQVRIKRAEQLTRDLRISSTPTVIVNGRYMVNIRAVSAPEQFVRLVRYLVQNP